MKKAYTNTETIVVVYSTINKSASRNTARTESFWNRSMLANVNNRNLASSLGMIQGKVLKVLLVGVIFSSSIVVTQNVNDSTTPDNSSSTIVPSSGSNSTEPTGRSLAGNGGASKGRLGGIANYEVPLIPGLNITCSAADYADSLT